MNRAAGALTRARAASFLVAPRPVAADFAVRFAGHSKWAKIARSKGANDAKRGNLFAKISKSITAAVKMGGADPNSNLRLAAALDRAKANNTPKDIIERALAPKSDAAAMEEVIYEGIGPGASAFICETLTDNKKRTVQMIRAMFSKAGGEMQTTGSLSWMFTSAGQIEVPYKSEADQDGILEDAINAGATDVEFSLEAQTALVSCEAGVLGTVRKALEAAGREPQNAHIVRTPTTTVQIADEEAAATFAKLLEDLEDHEDVQAVFHNVEEADE